MHGSSRRCEPGIACYSRLKVFSPHHFFHKQVFKDRLSSSVDLCLQRQSKDVLGFLVFLGFFGFFLGSCVLYFIYFFSGTIC